ncbi:MAG: Phosphotransferase enzyme [Bogoriella megaspora]|nr:MAG: Phosphotransferase enzyme [Bogoriella megaspora]
MPENLSSLSKSERVEAIECFRRRHLHFYYFAGAKKFNNDHYKTLRLQSTALKQRLYFNASAPWTGNNIPLKAALIGAQLNWDVLISESTETMVPCPILFSEAEIAECLRIGAAQDGINQKLGAFRNRLGISTDGWVPLDAYEHALTENQRLKDEALVGITEEQRRDVLQNWPFDDHAED